MPKSLQKIQITSYFDDDSAPKTIEEIDFLEKVNFEIEQTDNDLKRTTEYRNNFLRDKFTEVFFQRIRYLSTNKNLTNKTLQNVATNL
jgi:hypothetical protein